VTYVYKITDRIGCLMTGLTGENDGYQTIVGCCMNVHFDSRLPGTSDSNAPGGARIQVQVWLRHASSRPREAHRRYLPGIFLVQVDTSKCNDVTFVSFFGNERFTPRKLHYACWPARRSSRGMSQPSHSSAHKCAIVTLSRTTVVTTLTLTLPQL
jgi:hypothetical protein